MKKLGMLKHIHRLSAYPGHNNLITPKGGVGWSWGSGRLQSSQLQLILQLALNSISPNGSICISSGQRSHSALPPSMYS